MALEVVMISNPFVQYNGKKGRYEVTGYCVATLHNLLLTLILLMRRVVGVVIVVLWCHVL